MPCLLRAIAATKVLIDATPWSHRFRESRDGDGSGGRDPERSATLWSSASWFLRRVARLGWLVFQNGFTGGKHQKEIDRMLWASVAAGDEDGARQAIEQGGRATCKLLELGPHDKTKDDTSCKTPLHLAAQMYPFPPSSVPSPLQCFPVDPGLMKHVVSTTALMVHFRHPKSKQQGTIYNKP